MYGLIIKMLALPGRRSELLQILVQEQKAIPGCHSYIIASDPSSMDGIWITEVWMDKDSHDASLQLPQTHAIIAKARPLIAGFADRFETEPLGGVGL
jgi:quinol monooxygenase YgiN